MNETKVRKKLSDITRLVYEKGYTSPLNGNMSIRLDDRHILITPTYTCKGLVEAENLLKVNFDGEVVDGDKKPSIEKNMHLAIYKTRSDVNGIIHAHPTNISVFAAANKPIDLAIMPEAVYLIGNVFNIQYCMPGSEALRDYVAKGAEKHDAFLLYNHGVITIGRDIDEAFYRLETLEKCAEILLKSASIGGAVRINDFELNKLYQVHESIKKGKA